MHNLTGFIAHMKRNCPNARMRASHSSRARVRILCAPNAAHSCADKAQVPLQTRIKLTNKSVSPTYGYSPELNTRAERQHGNMEHKAFLGHGMCSTRSMLCGPLVY